MANLADIHAALAAQLETIDGLRVADFPGQGLKPPCAWLELVGWRSEAMGRGGEKTYIFDLLVFSAQSVRPQDGYRALMTYADSSGDNSIDLAIWDGNSAGTFGGLASTHAHIAGFSVLGAEQVDAYQMYGGSFTVEVHTRG